MQTILGVIAVIAIGLYLIFKYAQNKQITLSGVSTKNSVKADVKYYIAQFDILKWDVRKGDAYIHITNSDYDFTNTTFVLMRWIKGWNRPMFDFKFKLSDNTLYINSPNEIILPMGPYRNCANWNNFETRSKGAGGALVHFFDYEIPPNRIPNGDEIDHLHNTLAIKCDF